MESQMLFKTSGLIGSGQEKKKSDKSWEFDGYEYRA